MNQVNMLLVKGSMFFRDAKQQLKQRNTSERGGISIEYALIGGAVLFIALAIASRIDFLGNQAENEIPSTLTDPAAPTP